MFVFKFLRFTALIALEVLRLALKPIPAKPAIAATPEPPTIDLTPDQIEAIQVAEQTANQIQAIPVFTPEPAPAKIVSWTELPPVTELPEVPEIPALEATPTGWASIEAGDEISEVPAIPAPAVAVSNKKSTTRGKLVEQHLEKAWDEGFRTYDQLMNYVELATGKACSKKVIAAWKKSRQANTEAVAA
jgi:hypothetical protein